MKRIIIVCSFLLMILPTIGQEKETFTITDAVVGVWREYYPEHISNLQWQPNSEYYTYREDDAIMRQKIGAKSGTALFDINTINSSLIGFGADSIKYIPYITWENINVLKFEHKNSVFFYDIKSKKIVKEYGFPESAENRNYQAEKHIYAFTTGNNLNIMNADGTYEHLTTERNMGIVYGQTVHRNEFGIEKGIYWSKQGNKLAYYRKDETMVSEYPLVDVSQRVAEAKMVRYPMAGMKSEEVTLMVYDINTLETITIETGEPKEQYLTNISWGPDEKYLYIAVLNREQNHMHFNCYNAKTGKFVKTLFEERHEKYVEPLHPITFLPENNDKFIWQSRRDGYNHLYLYNTKGELLQQLTKGEYEITKLYTITNDGSYAYFQANKESPIDFDIYRLDINTGNMHRISSEPGNHDAIISSDGKYIIDKYSNIDKSMRYVIKDFKGNEKAVLLDAKNPLEKFDMPDCKLGTIKAADDSTELYYRLITPSNMGKGKKYPAIIYVYGGPHAQLITNSWLAGGQGWLYYMAQQGYIMLTVDNRGSANRGMDFENIIHRNAGVNEIADQMEGVEFLETLGYVDMNRIGVHGWSYGGFMTTTLMTTHNDVFKVGCAGGPVIDWKYYEVMYGERYMDTPDENPEGYENSSLTNKADKLTGRLLIIHGAQDGTVVWQHSQDFLQSCIKAGTLPDYFVYPSHEHNVRGMDRIHLMRMITRYFNDNL